MQAVIAGSDTPAADEDGLAAGERQGVATKPVDVPANGRATVSFAARRRLWLQSLRGARSMRDDAFPLDDASLSRCAGPIRSGCCSSMPRATRGPHSILARRWPRRRRLVRLQSSSAEQPADLDPRVRLRRAVGRGVAAVRSSSTSLRDYVTAGGSVLIALGTGAAHHGHIPLWGSTMRTGMIHASGGSARWREVDFHPSRDLPMRSPAATNGGWAGTTKFLYAAGVDPAQARVAARLSDGTPLLLDKQLGEGHVLLFASGFDNLTNDLPLILSLSRFIDRSRAVSSGHRAAQRIAAWWTPSCSCVLW